MSVTSGSQAGEQPKRRILCIDGGGIHGTFPAALLAELEQHLDNPIASYFDLIAGTSTGGIIAIALSLVENVAQNIDIPPGKYQQAVDRYSAVGRWLEDGAYKESVDDSSIYPQGSFRLGTVVRPIRGGIDADYDIDLVCELPIPKQRTEPRQVKVMVGDRLREHTVYCRLLDDEGKRCWTLEYKEQDGIGFHLDVLPSVPDPRYGRDTAIAITDKRGNDHSWVGKRSAGVRRLVRQPQPRRVRAGCLCAEAVHF